MLWLHWHKWVPCGAAMRPRNASWLHGGCIRLWWASQRLAQSAEEIYLSRRLRVSRFITFYNIDIMIYNLQASDRRCTVIRWFQYNTSTTTQDAINPMGMIGQKKLSLFIFIWFFICCLHLKLQVIELLKNFKTVAKIILTALSKFSMFVI